MQRDTPIGRRDARPGRVLVTGGAGFIGSHLVSALAARGDRVTVVDDLSTGAAANLDGSDAELIVADLGESLPDLARRDPFDRVYHLAAAVGVELVLADPVRAIEINTETTSALLRHLAAHGAPPTLVASSSEVYGKPGTGVFSEDDDALYGATTVTRWSYALAKALDEHLALAYHRTRGLPVVVARFFNTVGPRQRGSYGMVLPRFVESAIEGRPLRVYGDGHQTRCFCDVRDVVPAIVALLDDGRCHGGVYNIGTDRSVSILELAELVVRVLASTSPVELVPYADAYPPGFEDLKHRRPDLARVRGAIGFEPTIPLEQTVLDIARTLAGRDACPASGRDARGNGGGEA